MRITQIDVPAGMIDLGAGQPDFELLPLALIRQAAERRLAAGDAGFLNYGYEQGDGHYRLALAGFLQHHYEKPVTAGQLLTTAGTSQAIDLICTGFARPGDTIFVEDPTYFLALQIFADRGLKVVSVPTDASGMQVEALPALLAKEKPAFLYTIPTFHNPTGVTLPAERREQLLALSRDHDFLIVADDVYPLLYYVKKPPPPLITFAGSERVISLGTFSKILAPGLRLGWIQAAPPLLAPLLESGLAASGGGFNPFTSALVQVILAEGWQERHLQRLRETYRGRLAAMVAALATEVEGVHFQPPSGGFFVWARLPAGVDAGAFRPAARGQGVDYRPGVRFSGRGGYHDYVRLCFAFYDEEQIREGVRRLGQALQER